ncbi:MAG: hypothetical protein K2N38_10150 [Oscillospiraceae bacterium]|nr:hypothetical protein [Oscillospiraceae bacterium]
MKKSETIRSSIRRGNLLILAGGLFLTVFFTVAMIFIGVCQRTEIEFSDNIARTSNSIIEANKIYREVDNIVYDGVANRSLDTSTPQFNSLVAASAEESEDVRSLIAAAQTLYDDLKNKEAQVVSLSATDNEAAQDQIDIVVYPALTALTDKLNEISVKYVEMTEKAGKVVTTVIETSTIAGLVLFVAMLAYSLLISKKMANNIAVPVVAVAEWAETLSTGSDNIESIHTSLDIQLEEIQRMIKSFTVMSENIKENVNVVRKVADGDMTAYVNIRSSEDSLGKSLYKMVQSNDIMFAQISQIADSVTEGTDSIASAARLLAESCTKQATAISDFQANISITNKLVKENAEAAAHASDLSDAIRNEVVVSKEKMQELVDAMQAINNASEKISGVIANIESLANQTNLLAINATIEAKRAGEAGKSFAVVASSIKDLADNSKASAAQTKMLVDDTINKAKRGSQISDETYTAFETIMNSLEQIIDVSANIADSGAKQQENMSGIEREIDEISRVVSTNAASSEETAAMTVEISKNAEVLKSSMKQFNLRNRTPGKPYIPPEKANDQDFIRIATDNYNKFLNSAEGKKIAAEMKTDKL